MSRVPVDAAGGEAIVDLHAHVLPGLDDGPRDGEASAQLLAALAAEGVATVCAPPHVSERSPTTLPAIAEALERVRGLPGPRIVPGAEVHPSQLARVLEDDPTRYALGDSGVVLV